MMTSGPNASTLEAVICSHINLTGRLVHGDSPSVIEDSAAELADQRFAAGSVFVNFPTLTAIDIFGCRVDRDTLEAPD